MGEEARGILIVTLRNDEDVEDIKERVSEIRGVVGVEYNHLTRKVLVRYAGEGGRLRKVELEIKKALEGDRKDERPQPSTSRKG